MVITKDSILPNSSELVYPPSVDSFDFPASLLPRSPEVSSAFSWPFSTWVLFWLCRWCFSLSFQSQNDSVGLEFGHGVICTRAITPNTDGEKHEKGWRRCGLRMTNKKRLAFRSVFYSEFWKYTKNPYPNILILFHFSTITWIL